MARENEDQSLREYGSRKKRYKKRKNIIIIMLLLLIAVAGASYLVYLYNRCYQNYKVIKSVDLTGESASGYLSFGSSVVRYSKNGAEAYDKDGKLLWNGSYEMTDPITDSCGNYIAIADKGGKSVQVFNEKGSAGNYTAESNITKIKVASQGVTAVLMQQGEDNYIKLYDLDGTELGIIKKSVNDTGYPLDFAISNDGRKLVVIYLSVTGGDMVSHVLCYSFDKVGKNQPDHFVGGYHFGKGTVASRAVFLNNNTFCIYYDKGFEIDSIPEIPKTIKRVSLKGKILSILHNKEHTGVVLESENGSSKSLLLYNLQGKQVLNKALDMNYKRIFLTEKEIILYDDLSCTVMKTNGKVKFKHTFEGDITEFYPVNNLDRYFLINEGKLAAIQLTQ
jgi:uncharacterized protein YxeA